MIIKKDNQYFVNCPECGKERAYKWKYLARKVDNNKIVCKSCVHSGNRHYLYGMTISDELKERMAAPKRGRKLSKSHKQKLSDIHTQRYQSELARRETSNSVKRAMHRPEIRKKHIVALAESKYLGKAVDKGQLELLEKWKQLGFEFEPNFQIHTETDLFYIDGYDSTHNVVLEYDSKYHHRPYQQQKDLERQQKIINILKPKKFWRYDATNKQFRNVVKG